MKIAEEDKIILQQLCEQYEVSYDKVSRLIETVKEYEFKDRRTGIYDALKEIIQSDLKGK
jgi:hypothetical protein